MVAPNWITACASKTQSNKYPNRITNIVRTSCVKDVLVWHVWIQMKKLLPHVADTQFQKFFSAFATTEYAACWEGWMERSQTGAVLINVNL